MRIFDTQSMNPPRRMVLIPVMALLLGPSPLLATTILGSAQDFAVLGGATVTNAGASTISGDIGVAPGTAITGLATVTLTGASEAGNADAQQAETDAESAFAKMSALLPNTNLTGQDLGSVGVLTPGVYNYSSSAELTGTLTLDFAGNQNQPFIFEIGSTLTTASGSDVAVMNGDQNSKVYFIVGSSATLGSGSTFEGNILADQSVTLDPGAAILCGRAIAINAAVTLVGNSVSNSCSLGGDLGSRRSDFGSDGFSGGSAGAVPEPATWAMMLVGFGGLGVVLRRRSAARRLAAGH